ncbi:MAG: sugar phosphate isomerase/epimerase [Thermoprotei archaeon]|nr:MAG: sugar phosphate isomerase/epimerase [Thermoprotei archaeon]
MRLGTSTYSYWHFEKRKMPLKYYLEKASEHGFEGVEILVDHFESKSHVYIKELKRSAFLNGLEIYAIAIHNDFVSPDKEERAEQIAYVEEWIEIAHSLGASLVRINSGRWRTIKSFDELMAKGGIEPPIPGYTEEDAVNWVVDCIYTCLDSAEDYGVILGLENHWGLTTNAKTMLKILERVHSKWFGVVMDTGNFISDTYTQLRMIAPYTVMVHAKTYFGGGVWYTLDIDYDRVFEILREVSFKGWISLEYEGKEEYESGIKKSIELLRGFIQ